MRSNTSRNRSTGSSTTGTTTYAIRSKLDPDQGTPRQGRYYELLCEEGTVP